jgi:hypothetical protein
MSLHLVPDPITAPRAPIDERPMRALEWASALVAIVVAILLNGAR